MIEPIHHVLFHFHFFWPGLDLLLDLFILCACSLCLYPLSLCLSPSDVLINLPYFWTSRTRRIGVFVFSLSCIMRCGISGDSMLSHETVCISLEPNTLDNPGDTRLLAVVPSCRRQTALEDRLL